MEAEVKQQEPVVEVVREPPHWLVKELFKMAKEKNLSHQDLEAEILRLTTLEGTPVKISKNTLKYWAYGHSTPKVDEADLIAKALGYEIELVLNK